MRGAQGNHHVIIENTNRVGIFHQWQGAFSDLQHPLT